MKDKNYCKTVIITSNDSEPNQVVEIQGISERICVGDHLLKIVTIYANFVIINIVNPP